MMGRWGKLMFSTKSMIHGSQLIAQFKNWSYFFLPVMTILKSDTWSSFFWTPECFDKMLLLISMLSIIVSSTWKLSQLEQLLENGVGFDYSIGLIVSSLGWWYTGLVDWTVCLSIGNALDISRYQIDSYALIFLWIVPSNGYYLLVLLQLHIGWPAEENDVNVWVYIIWNNNKQLVVTKLTGTRYEILLLFCI